MSADKAAPPPKNPSSTGSSSAAVANKRKLAQAVAGKTPGTAVRPRAPVRLTRGVVQSIPGDGTAVITIGGGNPQDPSSLIVADVLAPAGVLAVGENVEVLIAKPRTVVLGVLATSAIMPPGAFVDGTPWAYAPPYGTTTIPTGGASTLQPVLMTDSIGGFTVASGGGLTVPVTGKYRFELQVQFTDTAGTGPPTQPGPVNAYLCVDGSSTAYQVRGFEGRADGALTSPTVGGGADLDLGAGSSVFIAAANGTTAAVATGANELFNWLSGSLVSA